MSAGSTLTFDLESLKESLDPVIWDLFPMDTYFQNTVDKVSVTNTQHQWLYDNLAAAANNKQLEGDDIASIATAATAFRVSNFTQIARKLVMMSDTNINGVKTVGGNPMGRQVMKSMKEYKRDIELDLLGRQGSSAGSTTLARASGGVCAWIFGTGATDAGNTVLPSTGGTGGNTTFTTPSYASSVVSGQVDGTTSTSSVVLADVTAAAELAWADGGEPDVIIASSAQKKKLDALSSLATRTVEVGRQAELSVQSSVNLFVTAFGTFKVVLSRYVPRPTILMLQMDKWAIGQLRAPKTVDLAKIGDGERKMIVGEYTLIARNPNSSAKIHGFVET